MPGQDAVTALRSEAIASREALSTLTKTVNELRADALVLVQPVVCCSSGTVLVSLFVFLCLSCSLWLGVLPSGCLNLARSV